MLAAHRAPRPRRSGRARGRRRRPRHDAAGDHRPRHRAAADVVRRRRDVDRLQRRDLQLPGSCARSWRRAGDRFRTSSDTEVILRAYAARRRARAWTGCAACSPSPMWDARRAPAVPGARPRRQEAALLLAATDGTLRLRLGDQGAALPPGRPGRDVDWPALASLPGLRLHARRPLGLRRHRQAAARPHRDRLDGGHADPASLLVAAGARPGLAPPGPARAGRGASGARSARRCGCAWRRRAARRVPVGWCRFQHRRRLHARGHQRAPRDVLHRLRRLRRLVRRAAATRARWPQRFGTEHHEEILEPEGRASWPG